MELVSVSVFGEGYYSGMQYSESLWLTKETFEKVKPELLEEIYLGELDGKHSEVLGEYDFDFYTEDDLISMTNPTYLDSDGDILENKVDEIMESLGLSYYDENSRIRDYLNSLDYHVEYSVLVPKSKYLIVKKAVGEILSKFETEEN